MFTLPIIETISSKPSKASKIDDMKEKLHGEHL